MDHESALAVINEELAVHGLPLLQLTQEQSRRAFASLCRYAAQERRPLDVAARDLARIRIQTIRLQNARSMS
jgi:hypothetical protein